MGLLLWVQGPGELTTTSEMKCNCMRATECGEEAWSEAARGRAYQDARLELKAKRCWSAPLKRRKPRGRKSGCAASRFPPIRLPGRRRTGIRVWSSPGLRPRSRESPNSRLQTTGRNLKRLSFGMANIIMVLCVASKPRCPRCRGARPNEKRAQGRAFVLFISASATSVKLGNSEIYSFHWRASRAGCTSNTWAGRPSCAGPRFTGRITLRRRSSSNASTAV